MQEMIVHVSTTCCFPEPRGQRPEASTMAFGAEGSGERGLWGSPECGRLNPGTGVSCLTLLYPSSLRKSQTLLTSKTQEGD